MKQRVVWGSLILLLASGGFSQTFLDLSASVDGAVCPGVDVVYNCTTDATGVFWTAAPYFIREGLLQLSISDSKNSGPVTVSPPLSRNPFTSTLTITSSDNLTSTEVICDADNVQMKSIPYRRILDLPRILPLEDFELLSYSPFFSEGRFVGLRWNRSPNVTRYTLSCPKKDCQNETLSGNVDSALFQVFTRNEVVVTLTAMYRCDRNTSQVMVPQVEMPTSVPATPTTVSTGTVIGLGIVVVILGLLLLAVGGALIFYALYVRSKKK